MPVLHLIAGPNGAGKSTLYQCLVGARYPEHPLVEAESHAASQLLHIPEPSARMRVATAWVDAQRQDMLQNGRSFITESSFSHSSRLALIAQARTLGFEVVLYALAVDEPRLLLERLNQRRGDHEQEISSHKVMERYARCLENFRRSFSMVNLVLLIDGIDWHRGGPRLVVTLKARYMQLHTAVRPQWVEKVLGFSEG